LSTDGRTDGHGETIIPPYNFVAGGIKKDALDSQPQVIKFTRFLPRVGGSLRVLQLPPPLKLVAMIYLKYY
jgi:hypothetical protein